LLHTKNEQSSARKRTRAREIPKSCKHEFPKIARNHWKKSHLMLAFLPELTGSQFRKGGSVQNGHLALSSRNMHPTIQRKYARL